ncbi:MAG: diacylglycerol kinase family protein, partial [Gemmatimonadales bacterium]
MPTEHIDVVATTISGSIKDWSKVERIVPLFHDHGYDDVALHVVDSHTAARVSARAAAGAGGRTIIAAGGSGTFNAVLEGCCDAGVPLNELRLGFLRKGSADLIGKVLGMPDEIEEAIAVFATSIDQGRTVPCDLLSADSTESDGPIRHFVGYGGAELFGRIPHYTENRYIKYYKGILSQVFGDLGPFTTGMTLALIERVVRAPLTRRRTWRITGDGSPIAEGPYQALIIVNGYLGPDLPFASEPLGSGRFHLFGIRDQGLRRLLQQARRARAGSIADDPERWGFESYTVEQELRLEPQPRRPFPVNVDGSTMPCPERAVFRKVDRLRL